MFEKCEKNGLNGHKTDLKLTKSGPEIRKA